MSLRLQHLRILVIQEQDPPRSDHELIHRPSRLLEAQRLLGPQREHIRFLQTVAFHLMRRFGRPRRSR